MGNVVAVTDVGEDEPRQPVPLFLDGHEVGQALARVLEVGQRVDDRNRGRAGQRFQSLLAECPNDHRMDVPGEDPAGVLDGLAPTQLELRGGEGDRMPAQLGHADFERHPCTGRRLLEDHRHREAVHPSLVRLGSRLDLLGQLEEMGELGRGEIVDGEEVPSHPGTS